MRSRIRNSIAALLILGLYLSASPASVLAQWVCQPSGSPVVTTSSLSTSDPTQTGRIVRDGIPSTCRGKTNGLQNSTVIHAKPFNFIPPVTGCATVDFNFLGCGANTTEIVAYSTYTPATPNTGLIGDPGFSSTGTGSFAFPVTSGVQFTLVVHEITPNVGCASFSFTINYSTGCRAPGYDRTNDGKSDPTFFRPSDGTWNILNSAGGTNSLRFGLAGDTPTPGDYTGDGQTDVSTYRTSANTWFYATSQVSPESNVIYVPWGVAGDIPVPGDYDRDGKTDIAIWRPSNGTWYVLRSSNATIQYFPWGKNGDTPVVGDFDGDLVTDFAVVRPDKTGITPNYLWYVLESNFAQAFFLRTQWGLIGDKIVPGDYNGDGRTDIAVYRPSDGTWYVVPIGTLTGTPFGFRWGVSSDIPQPADYDGDKFTDFAVFRPSEGRWYISNSNNGAYGTYTAPLWGTSTDTPASAPYTIRP